MNSKEYWRKREEEALEKYQKSEAEYDKEIKRIYSNMLADCQTQINAFYGRYADKEGITLAEAKKRVKTADIKDFERKAAQYVKDKDFSDKANEEMRLYNTMMKINRLEMLKANIGLEMIAGHNELEKFMSGILKGRTEEELARQAGILGKTVRNNAKLAHAIPNASFHNATFSDRIWQYQDLMREDLSKILSRALIQGKNPRAVAKELQKYWYGNDPRTGGGAVYCMERLMRTELARVQTEAQKQSFIRNGFDKYTFIPNAGCCDLCTQAAKKDVGYGEGVYLVKDMMPGENASPLHPHCRCSTAAHSDRKEYDEWLDFLEKGGTTAEYEKLKAKGVLTKSAKGSNIDPEIIDDNISHSVVEGEDLSGKIDYNNSQFDYDIETALHAQGFDGLPKVVKTQKEFDDLVQNDHFLGERTLRAADKETLDLYEHQLKNDYFYVNCGVGGAQYGQGMYCAADYSKGKVSFDSFKHEIDTYAQNQQSRTFWLTMDKSSKILNLPYGVKAGEYIPSKYSDNYLLTHSKGTEHEAVKRYIKAKEEIEKAYATGNYADEILDPLYEARNKAQSEISQKLFDEVNENMKYYPPGFEKWGKYKNEGTLVAEMGYDAINAEGHGATDSYTVVLNRTKLIIYGGADYEYNKK